MGSTVVTTIEPQRQYIEMKFSGDLSDERAENFKSALATASELIMKYSKKEGKKVCVLLDMTDFTGTYGARALLMLVDFAKNNKALVERTASFGGSDKVKIAGEVAISLSGRENIRIFEDKDEAVSWLLQPESR